MGSGLKGQRLIALFLLGLLLLNYPLFSLFVGQARVFGIPLPYVYVFVVWILFILLMALIIERHQD